MPFKEVELPKLGHYVLVDALHMPCIWTCNNNCVSVPCSVVFNYYFKHNQSESTHANSNQHYSLELDGLSELDCPSNRPSLIE